MASLSTKEYQRQWRAKNTKKCSAYENKYKSKNPEKWKAYAKRYRESHYDVEYFRKWRAANRKKVSDASRKWRRKNSQRMALICRTWRLKNLDHVNSHERNRCASDPAYKLAKTLRGRVRNIIKSQSVKKSGVTLELTGCSPVFLMGYLEARFRPGMNWSNHGEIWEIDHLFPCSSYDLTDPKQQRACFHYTNLQPLFVKENRMKKDKIPGVSWMVKQQ